MKVTVGQRVEITGTLYNGMIGEVIDTKHKTTGKVVVNITIGREVVACWFDENELEEPILG